MDNLYERGILELASTPEMQKEVIERLQAALLLQGKKPRVTRTKNKFDIDMTELEL